MLPKRDGIVSSASWIDRYVSEVEKYTDSPLVLIRGAAYFTMAAAIRKKAFYRSSRDTYPNFYLVIVGPPSRFRKTYAIELGLRILRRVVPSVHFLPQGGSDVAFDDAMSEANGYGIAYYEELMEFLSLAGREHSTQLEARFLRYFNPSMISYKVRTRKDGEKEIPAGSVVAMATACVDDQFQEFMSGGALSSGQVSRCIVLRPTEKDARTIKTIEPRIPESFYAGFAKELACLVPGSPKEIAFSKEAIDAIGQYQDAQKEWYEKNRDPRLERATARFPELLKRLSLTRAVSRGSMTISADDVDRGYSEIMEPYLYSVKRFFKFGILERQDQKIRSRIAQQLDRGPSTPRILSRTLNEPMSTIQQNLRVLLDMGEVHTAVTGKTVLWIRCDGWCDSHKDDLSAELEAVERYYQSVRSKWMKERNADSGVQVSTE